MRAVALASALALACGTKAPPSAPPAAPTAPVPEPTTASPAPVFDAGSDLAPPAPTVPPAAELLRDGFEQRFAERALPRAGHGNSPPRPVVAQEPGRARFIFDDSGLRLLVWAEDAALWETPLAVTALTRSPGTSGAKPRVLVGPGAFLERKSEKNGFVKVSAHDRTMSVEGFLPAGALGRVYVPAAVPAIASGESWALARTARLLDKPGGTALGRLLDSAGPQVLVTELSKGAAWFVEVAYHSPTLSVRGFVPKSALSPPERYGWGSGYGYAARKNPPDERLTFPVGACLYAEPWGEVVGVLRRPRTATVHIESGERAAWRELDLPWTGTRVWVPREGASASELEDPKQPLDLKQGFSCAAAPGR